MADTPETKTSYEILEFYSGENPVCGFLGYSTVIQHCNVVQQMNTDL
jgi:hypothetical protein